VPKIRQTVQDGQRGQRILDRSCSADHREVGTAVAVGFVWEAAHKVGVVAEIAAVVVVVAAAEAVVVAVGIRLVRLAHIQVLAHIQYFAHIQALDHIQAQFLALVPTEIELVCVAVAVLEGGLGEDKVNQLVEPFLLEEWDLDLVSAHILVVQADRVVVHMDLHTVQDIVEAGVADADSEQAVHHTATTNSRPVAVLLAENPQIRIYSLVPHFALHAPIFLESEKEMSMLETFNQEKQNTE